MIDRLRPKHYLTLAMMFAFVSFGLFCIFSSTFEAQYLRSPRNYIMGGVMLLYATLRFFRLRSELTKYGQ